MFYIFYIVYIIYGLLNTEYVKYDISYMVYYKLNIIYKYEILNIKLKNIKYVEILYIKHNIY